MVMAKSSRCFYEFGPFRLDPEKNRLLRDGEPVHLSPKSLEALVVLVQNAGKLLEREALIQAVWADTFVEDANLTVAISHLRKVLGQNTETPEYIETIPRVGYRFVADVRETSEEPKSLIIEKRTLSRTVIEEEDVPHDNAIAMGAPAKNLLKLGLRPMQWRLGVLAAIIVIVAVATTAYFLRNRSQPVSASSINSLAVLPFTPLGPQPNGEDYLGVGLSDSLITRLSQIKRFVVRPTSAIVKFADGHQDPLKAGRELGVEGVLNGRISRDADHVRVTVELLRVSDGQSLWSQSFDERFTNLFGVEDAISEHVAQALATQISGDEHERLKKRGTENSDAFNAFLRGRYALSKRTPQDVSQAIKFFRQAIDLDPTYPSAYSGLADSYLLTGDYGWAPASESFPLARAAALKALEIDEAFAEAHSTLGHVEFLFNHDWSAAERDYRRGIELKPNYANGHHWYGWFLIAMGRTDEALREIKQAEELDPLSLIIKANVGTFYYFARDYDHAIELQRKVVATDRNFLQGRRKLAFSLEAKGLESEALKEWLEVEREMGTTAAELARYEQAGSKSGIRGYWEQATEIEAAAPDNPNRAGALFSYYSRLGEIDKGFYWLDRAVEDRSPWLVYAKVSPVFDNLRNDPRFLVFLKRMGFTSQ